MRKIAILIVLAAMCSAFAFAAPTKGKNQIQGDNSTRQGYALAA